ncbi:hypothetical protein O181_101657 [Austropuccinia psidii MF-1]|uniref:DUF4939 domain-containing protein n=1 Tax=Austropuccinia psidii MF-1 TaxID=1389203 RepID=A0A9Q3JGE8_9BASI|nr:hypothetical protein [Austropuccinia psidii MF-1]
MRFQHSPPARQTRAQARAKAVLTPTPRAPLDGTPAVPQLRAQLDRGAALSRKEGKGIRSSDYFSGQMTQIMANLQADSSRPPALKTPSMNAPECFDGTQPFKGRNFIQYCQLIFYNDVANFPQDRKKFLYAASFLICRAAKWIEPYLSNLTNKDPN